jgi:hypothetical protein
MKKVMAKLEIIQELEVEDNATPEDMQTTFNEVLGQIDTEVGFVTLMKFTEIRKTKNKVGKIPLDELADEVVLPEMLVYPGDKLDLDFIVEKAHHTDHRANKENVRLALNQLEGEGLIIRSNKPDHWIAVIQH